MTMTLYYILFFVFLFVSLIVIGAYRFYAYDKKSAKIVNQRLQLLNEHEGSDLALKILRDNRGIWLLNNKGRFHAINKRIVQTGLDLNYSMIMKLIFAAITICLLVFLSLSDSNGIHLL